MFRPTRTRHALLAAFLAVVAAAAAASTVHARTNTALRLRQRSLQQQEPSLGLPYTDGVGGENSEDEKTSDDNDNILKDSAINDRHSPVLPDRQPYDVDPQIITIKPTGTGTTSGAGGEDSSLGLPYILVIGGSVFLVLTGVIVAARRMRDNNDENEDDEDDEGSNDENNESDLEAMENADAAKDGAAATGGGKKQGGPPAMDFTSIVVEEEEMADVGEGSNHMVDTSMDTTAADTDEARPSGLLGNDGEDSNDESDNAMMLTV
mmetsp:Transcript_2700/g.5785  ORF Transcript_2700/g.5785 Transcript_2700/m.5785 type:complete len:264 (+) Transcript_2700:148-939(+)|eukprot:CAMPEP_0178631318 /NCGR_PEP_ID=MMETSP0698-20121128/10943_1 /TAXON_ID=265572 /ORGANISM="Extubocellulus spinifer, Strain CCMP396" /LENGTH=263 /DNA_ID=CAMNT_0020270731 /DNA_START=122 /DNA_END=913 /DNA_ORIENTATION=-